MQATEQSESNSRAQSVCKCGLYPGHWYAGGWHWRAFNEAESIFRADVRWLKEYGRDLMRANRQDARWEQIFAELTAYYGSPLAVDQCKGHQALIADQRKAEKAKGSSKGNQSQMVD